MEAEAHDIIRDLDPFGFMVGSSSVIRPLGGGDRHLDPRYAFHTPYVEFRPGRVLFTIRFDRLKASFGELRVNINAYIPGSGRDAIFVTSVRLHLNDSSAVERGLSIPFLTVAGASYAAYGYCTEGTDAQAAGISIKAEQLDTSDESSAQQPLLPTSHAAPDIETSSKLVAETPLSFRNPVSQPASEEQLADPAFFDLAARLSPRSVDAGQTWKLAFVARALDRYGMLRPGTRGIAWGADGRALAPIIKAAGSSVFLADPPIDSLSWTAITGTPIEETLDPANPEASAAIVSLADEPAHQRGFDFLWTIDMAGKGYAAGSTHDLLLDLMTVLRPGGVAVHMFDMAIRGSTVEQSLPRGEIERLAVTLLARGFSVAQLNFGQGTAQGGDVPFGLIVKKD